MSNPAGEMPFLDHLEELRKRILLALAGVMAGLGAGWWLTRHFELIRVIEAPIKPYVAGGKLMVTSLLDPFMLNFKLAIVAGLVLSSPWVIYQLWIFLAPALTPREKRALLPSLGVGLLLFLGGAAIGWIWVVPPTVKWFIQFDLGSFNTQITYDSYVSLVIHVLLAMGVSAELPLVMVLLAALGVVPYRMYKKLRRYAFFLSFVGGAFLSPTPEVVSMILFTIPLLLLYEVGVFGAWLIEKRNIRAMRNGAVVGAVLLAAVAPHRLSAQVPPAPPSANPGIPSDTVLRGVTGLGVHTIDSATAKRLGIPSKPSRVFPSPDSIMQELLYREGFAATRYVADSAAFDVDSQRILLSGRAATDRDERILEADRIRYDDLRCEAAAEGAPRMFEPGKSAMIGVTMRFNTCSERGMIGEAFTSFNELGANWFIRGNLAVDSSGKRLYAAHTEFTSCDLPDPHYHFVTGQMKWVSQSVMVARPAVLYVRDVPVAWLPFIFQDTKNGRASGILIPRFGFNDIVRTDRNYNRQFTNIGYYWAPNVYIDATASLDWYANRNTTYRGQFEYHWLDRFVTGSITVGDLIQTDGLTTKTISWQHNQNFNVTTSIALNFNYASSGSVLQNNTIDPTVSTRGVQSGLSLQKRFWWGQVSIGGTRNQSLTDGSGTMSLPTLNISPSPLALGRHITWSPAFSAHNDLAFGTPLVAQILTPGGVDTSRSTGHTRLSVVTLNTPIDLYGLTWSNSVQYQDRQLTGPITVLHRVPNTATIDPNDSINVSTVRNGDFDTRFDWTTSVALPSLFRSTWKVTPSVGVTNVIENGPFLIRTPGSGGNWVAQGKKLAFGITAAPSFFGFLNRGFGPYQRFRYEFSPSINLNWSPAASVSTQYAQALASSGGLVDANVPAKMNASISFHQAFVGKVRVPAGDTNTDPIHLQNLPKKQILGITTSAISYDLEQAKLPGRTGWTTGVLTNSFTSDLLQGFTLSMTHDLWQGQVGTDTARFSPFLSNVQAQFSITGHTFRTIAGFLGLVHRDTVTAKGPAPVVPVAAATALPLLRSGGIGVQPLVARGFNANITYQLTRLRPIGPTAQPVLVDSIGGFGAPLNPIGSLPLIPFVPPEPQSSLGLTMSFSPTAFWTVSWQTQYDITHGSFQQTQIQLQRDLHDWRASFNFVKNVNGNFALYFSVFLINLPDIKFDYNQTTLQQTPLTP